VWHRAQARSLKPRRAFKLSFALVTALLVLTLGSLAVWSMYSLRGEQPHQAVRNETVDPAPAPSKTPEQKKSNEPVQTAENHAAVHPVVPNRSVKPRVKQSTMTPAAPSLAQDSSAIKETTIGTWQSPTSALLTSSTDELFKSVPQLNENANEMKSVLPGRANDKEK